jgi:hypothetical protein
MVAPETTAGERKVIRWFFGTLFVVAVVYLAFTWIGRERECDAACSVAGLGEGDLVFTGRNRLELSSHCECARGVAEGREAD